MRSASRSASASVERFVLTRGIVGVDEAARPPAARPAQAGTPLASARVIRTDDSIFEPDAPRKTPLTGGMSW
jgi:hypothetical protein